jgi:hypothetical protein
VATVPAGQGRSKTFGLIRLAHIRFVAGEAEQACDDGEQALQLAEHMTSARIQIRLRELLTASKPYADVPRVMEFQERLRAGHRTVELRRPVGVSRATAPSKVPLPG